MLFLSESVDGFANHFFHNGNMRVAEALVRNAGA